MSWCSVSAISSVAVNEEIQGNKSGGEIKGCEDGSTVKTK